MKYILSFLITVLVVTSASSQTKVGLKVYQNTDVFDIGYYEMGPTTTTTHLNFNRMSFAINLTSKHEWIHEVEIFIPEINKSINRVQFPFHYQFHKNDHVESSISTYSLRYEISRAFLNLSNRFTFSSGIGINPCFIYLEDKPKDQQFYYRFAKYYGASITVIPRMAFKLTNRFTLDLSIPFKVYELGKAMQHVDNPAIPIKFQTNGGMEHTFFPKTYTLRFGLMFALNK